MRRVAVVASRFNAEIADRLLESCLKTLRAAGVAEVDIRVVRVPGAYELPWTVQELSRSGRYGVVIALGAVLKGSTPQNDHISRSTIQHLHDVQLSTGVPCVLGVITPLTFAQARARTKGGLDRGREAAQAALEMLKVRRELEDAHG